MGKPLWIGYIVLLLVPLLLWVGVSVLARRKRSAGRRLVAFVAGGDGRLSLSCLQALLWTLVIIGGYVAAMVVHERSKPMTPTQSALLVAEAARSDTLLRDATTHLRLSETALKTAADASRAANGRVNDLKVRAAAYVTGETAQADSAKAIAQRLIAALVDQGVATNTLQTAEKDKARNTAELTVARADVDSLTQQVAGLQWVAIPGALLALAGISLGAGVFSSLISAVTEESQEVGVSDIQPVDGGASLRKYLITGSGFSEGIRATVDGKAVTVDLLKDRSLEVCFPEGQGTNLLLDTPGGRILILLNWVEGRPRPGERIPYHEFADLFRDDKNPRRLSLMKFQMFAWTLVGLTVYLVLFCQSLSSTMASLPPMSETLVLLTGLSQGGYLSGKAVAAVNRTPV